MRRTAVLLCLVGLFGCEAVKDVLSQSDKPTARITGVRLDGLSLEGLSLEFDVKVDNPYSVGLPLVALDYALSSRGQQFLAGQGSATGTVPAKGSRTIPLTAGVKFADLLAVLSSVRPGNVVPYTADIKLGVDAPAVGRITLPLSKSGELPVPTVPDVSLAKVEWDKLELTQARAVLHVAIKNTNDFSFGLEKLGYDLTLGGSKVANSAVEKSTRFNKGGTQTLRIPISLSPINLGMGVFNMLRGKDASYGLSGTMNVDTPFGALEMPYDKTGRTPFQR